MTREALRGAFIHDRGEAFAQRVERRDGRGVVIFVRVVIIGEQLQVEIPDRVVDLAGAQLLDGARRSRERREAGRAAQSFLRTTIRDVDTGRVGVDGDAAQRGDAIGDDQRADRDARG